MHRKNESTKEAQSAPSHLLLMFREWSEVFGELYNREPNMVEVECFWTGAAIGLSSTLRAQQVPDAR